MQLRSRMFLNARTRLLQVSFLLLCLGSATAATNNLTRTEVLHELTASYDNKIPPNFDKDEPLKIAFRMFVSSMSDLDESSMEYGVTLFLLQRWRDPRLSYAHLLDANHLLLDSHMVRDVWTPDMFFGNERKRQFHKSDDPNSLIRLYPDGEVAFSMRMSLTLDCPMDLHTFPMDTQICQIDMETYAFGEETFHFQWSNDSALEISPKLRLSRYILVDADTSSGIRSTAIGNFSTLRVHFLLRRDIGFYVIQTYIPTSLIVVLSWVGFWIDPQAVPARISLSVTSVLTMATQTAGLEARLPKVSYIKAMDVWMAMCSIFVFCALLEFALVNVLLRKDKKPQRNGVEVKAASDSDSDEEANTCRFWRRFNLDKLSRIIFPSVFVVFNFVYWPVFQYMDHEVKLE